ncbi:MAG: hypothetical protein R3F40_04850 [Candidatus Competibacteraceae bacterium]
MAVLAGIATVAGFGLAYWHRAVFETAIFATVALLLAGSARWQPPRIRWL